MLVCFLTELRWKYSNTNREFHGKKTVTLEGAHFIFQPWPPKPRISFSYSLEYVFGLEEHCSLLHENSIKKWSHQKQYFECCFKTETRAYALNVINIMHRLLRFVNFQSVACLIAIAAAAFLQLVTAVALSQTAGRQKFLMLSGALKCIDGLKAASKWSMRRLLRLFASWWQYGGQ